MAALASLGLILLIMMFLTRSLVAALVIVGTVALSLAASFGMSVVVWQYIFGIPLYWVIFRWRSSSCWQSAPTTTCC